MPGKVKSLSDLNRRVLLIAWLALGLIVLIASQSCSAIWAFGNRSPHHWDNAMYVNRAWVDLWAYTNGGPTKHQTGVRGVWDSLINADPYAPPAYRMATVPFIFWGARMLAVLRTISLLTFWLTLYVIYRTAALAIDGHTGRVAGIISAMLVGMYLEVGWSIRIYGTEFTLYFSTALLLYCMARGTRICSRPHLTWIGLGFAVGLGMLSKVSFPLIAGPPLLIAGVLVLMRKMPGLSIWKLMASAAIAFVMAWPFYSRHWKTALEYAEDMTKFTRHSLHRRGWELLKAWGQLHLKEGIGVNAATILGALIVAAILTAGIGIAWKKFRQRQRQDGPAIPMLSPELIVILLALSQALVLPIYQLICSQSNNVRHVSPAYLPLSLAVVLLAARVGTLLNWHSWIVFFFTAWMAFSQLHQIDAPLTTTVDDCWDWAPLYQLAESRGIAFPMIGRVGNYPQFCDPFLTEPWESRGRFANTLWLWRPEDGPFDLNAVRAKLADRNLLVTAPDFHGSTDQSILADHFEQDNQHNAEYAHAMLADPSWELAGKFPIGLIHHAEIWVFVRRKP